MFFKQHRRDSRASFTQRNRPSYVENNADELGELEQHAAEDAPSEEEKREYEIQSDIYALIFLYGTTSLAFVYGLVIIALQLAVIFLFYLDLLSGGHQGNRLNIPTSVETQVAAAQFMAIPLCIMCHDDCTTALYQLGALYDPDIKKEFPHATRTAWISVVFLRFAIGFLLVFASFIQVVQSTSVTDLFLNIESIVFVGELDELAFWLAEKNFILGSLRDSCEKVHDNAFKASHGSRRAWARRSCALATCLALVIGWSLAFSKQKAGFYLDESACHIFHVSFGDYTLELDPSKINATGTIRENPITNNELVYSAFSGTYVAGTHSSGIANNSVEVIDRRPRYFESINGIEQKDRSLGMFQYCGGHWIFTIEPLMNAFERKNKANECEHWLLRSPKTDALTLEEVGFNGWVVWTGEVEDAILFSFRCTDCYSDVDCSLRGTCNVIDRTCECEPGRLGSYCEIEPCRVLDGFEIGESSAEWAPEGTFNLLSVEKFEPIEEGENALLIYGRPVFQLVDDIDSLNVYLFYLGSRWNIAIYTVEEFAFLFNASSYPAHGFWDSLFTTRGYAYSTLTNKGLPTGLTWFESLLSRSRGDFGPFLASSKVSLELHCRDRTCDGLHRCGFFGSCNNETGRCECSNCHGGYYCQFPPSSEYAKDQFGAWLANDNVDALEASPYYNEFWKDVEFWTECPGEVASYLELNGTSARQRRASSMRQFTKRKLVSTGRHNIAKRDT